MPFSLQTEILSIRMYKVKLEKDPLPRKLATAAQPQFPRNIIDFKQATGFRISGRTLRKLMFD
jgi:hypothetical protein